MRAVIYARYSSESQREESIEGQLRECYAFARKNDISVIGEYIDRAIMLRAEQELLKTDRSILSISEELGFCDACHFTKNFSKNVGTSPLSYRKYK
jgi:AraC-like DNA-binding protein